MKKLSALLFGCAAVFGSVCHADAQTKKSHDLDPASRNGIKIALSLTGMDKHVRTDKNGRFDITSYQQVMHQLGYRIDSVKSKVLNDPDYPETRGDTLVYAYAWKRGESGVMQIEDILAHPKNSKMADYDINNLTISDIYYLDNTGDRFVYHMEKNEGIKPTALVAQFLSTTKVMFHGGRDTLFNNDFVQESYTNYERIYLLQRINKDGYYQLHDMSEKIKDKVQDPNQENDYTKTGHSQNRYYDGDRKRLAKDSFAIFEDVRKKPIKIPTP